MKKTLLLILCVIPLRVWSIDIYTPNLTGQGILDKTAAQVGETAEQTSVTLTEAELEFKSTCIVMSDPTVECNTAVGGAKICTAIRCDASQSAISTAYTACMTLCTALEAKAKTAASLAATYSKTPWTYGLALFYKAQASSFTQQATQCNTECTGCQTSDNNATDQYANSSVCAGGQYAAKYNAEIKTAKANALKKEKKCRKFCSGKSKLNWTKIMGIVAVTSALTSLASNTQDKGSDDETDNNTNEPPPSGDCSLKTNEVERVKCYCESVPGYEYSSDKGCVPTGLGTTTLGESGGSKPSTFSGNLAAGTTKTEGSSGSSDTAGSSDGSSASGAGSGAGGLAGAEGGASGKKDDAKKLGTASGGASSGRTGSTGGGTAGVGGAEGSYGSGSVSTNDAPSVDAGVKKPVTDILKKEESLFDSIQKVLIKKYETGTLMGV